jgi:hypothetical protein
MPRSEDGSVAMGELNAFAGRYALNPDPTLLKYLNPVDLPVIFNNCGIGKVDKTPGASRSNASDRDIVALGSRSRSVPLMLLELDDRDFPIASEVNINHSQGRHSNGVAIFLFLEACWCYYTNAPVKIARGGKCGVRPRNRNDSLS